MELEYKADIDAALGRIKALWNREDLDRPLISVTAPNGLERRRIPPPATMADKVLDFDYRLDFEEEEIRCTYYGGEAIPTVWPDFGPSITAACLGGGLEIGDVDPELPITGNIWSTPVIDDWERDFDKIGFNPENIWWKRSLEFTRRARERGEGKYFQIILDVDGGADTCADLRCPSKLCIDLYENPEWVQKLLEVVRKGNAEIVNRLHAKVEKSQGGCVTTFKLWAPGRSYNMRNDFAYLISPQQFRDAFLQPMIAESQTIDYTVFHIHQEDYLTNTKARLEWLDVVLSIPRIQGVQWYAWGDYKRIIDSGKFVVSHLKLKHLPELINAMEPEYMKRIWVITQADSQEEAEGAIRMMERVGS